MINYSCIRVIFRSKSYNTLFSPKDSMRCEGDICWEDLLSPLGSLVHGDAIAEVLEWTLALSLIVPPTLYFSRLKI